MDAALIGAAAILRLGLGVFFLGGFPRRLDLVLHVLDALLELREALADSPGDFRQAASEDQDGDDQDDDPLGPAGEAHECQHGIGHGRDPLVGAVGKLEPWRGRSQTLLKVGKNLAMRTHPHEVLPATTNHIIGNSYINK